MAQPGLACTPTMTEKDMEDYVCWQWARQCRGSDVPKSEPSVQAGVQTPAFTVPPPDKNALQREQEHYSMIDAKHAEMRKSQDTLRGNACLRTHLGGAALAPVGAAYASDRAWIFTGTSPKARRGPTGRHVEMLRLGEPAEWEGQQHGEAAAAAAAAVLSPQTQRSRELVHRPAPGSPQCEAARSASSPHCSPRTRAFSPQCTARLARRELMLTGGVSSRSRLFLSDERFDAPPTPVSAEVAPPAGAYVSAAARAVAARAAAAALAGGCAAAESFGGGSPSAAGGSPVGRRREQQRREPQLFSSLRHASSTPQLPRLRSPRPRLSARAARPGATSPVGGSAAPWADCAPSQPLPPFAVAALAAAAPPLSRRSPSPVDVLRPLPPSQLARRRELVACPDDLGSGQGLPSDTENCLDEPDEISRELESFERRLGDSGLRRPLSPVELSFHKALVEW